MSFSRRSCYVHTKNMHMNLDLAKSLLHVVMLVLVASLWLWEQQRSERLLWGPKKALFNNLKITFFRWFSVPASWEEKTVEGIWRALKASVCLPGGKTFLCWEIGGQNYAYTISSDDNGDTAVQLLVLLLLVPIFRAVVCASVSPPHSLSSPGMMMAKLHIEHKIRS